MAGDLNPNGRVKKALFLIQNSPSSCPLPFASPEGQLRFSKRLPLSLLGFRVGNSLNSILDIPGLYIKIVDFLTQEKLIFVYISIALSGKSPA
jgi:hypothetical protein